MFAITNDHINELNQLYTDRKAVKLALCRAVVMIPNQNSIQKETIFRLAKNLLEENKKVPEPKKKEAIEIITDTQPKEKSKRGRKPFHRGKLILGGTKKAIQNFWRDIKDAERVAADDKYYPEAQPGGNYKRTKIFLREDWNKKSQFTLTNLKEELTKKYPNKSDFGGFRLQRWGNASYWANTGKIAIKPLWKKISRFDYKNIFYLTNYHRQGKR